MAWMNRREEGGSQAQFDERLSTFSFIEAVWYIACKKKYKLFFTLDEAGNVKQYVRH